MKTFLYGRTSTLDQNTDLQKKALTERYPEGLYREEKVTGTSMKNREMLKLILYMIDQGEKLVVWKLDRLARNMNDLCQIVTTLEEKGASLEILDQAIDTSTPSGKAFLQMLGVFSEFETNLRKERQLAGIAAAQAKGKHCGRKASLTDTQKQEIRDQYQAGTTPTALAKQYGVSRATVYNTVR